HDTSSRAVAPVASRRQRKRADGLDQLALVVAREELALELESRRQMTGRRAGVEERKLRFVVDRHEIKASGNERTGFPADPRVRNRRADPNPGGTLHHAVMPVT